MASLPKVMLSQAEAKILRLIRKKKKINCRDSSYWDCEALVKRTALDKFHTKRGRSAGWPHYKLSKRGRKALEYYEAIRRQPR